jgi:hypothetical protein
MSFTKWQRKELIKALSNVLATFKTKNTLDDLLDKFLYRAIVYSCSKDRNEDDLYVDYAVLFTGILKFKSEPDFHDDLVDKFFEKIFQIIQDLNLSIDDEKEVVATNIKDHMILDNLQRLIQLIVPSIRQGQIRNRLSYLISHLIDGSKKNPMVPRFYELLCFFIEHFFDKNSEEQLIILLKRHGEDVIVKIYNFKDDLLAACLQLIMTLVETDVLDVKSSINALEMGLKFGLSYKPIAVKIIPSLDGLLTKKRLELEPFFHLIVPIVGEYLLIQTANNFSGTNAQSDTDYLVIRDQALKLLGNFIFCNK